MIKLSIVTVVRNDANGLERTLQSVIAQTFKDLEYVVIDGNSSDDTISVIERNENQIDKWISEADNGIYDAMNKGINISKGEWVIFLNAGDEFANENVLESVFKEEEATDKIIYGDSILIGKDQQTHMKAKTFSRNNLVLWGTRVLCHQAIFVKRAVLGSYDLNYLLKAELNWYFDLLTNVKASNIRQIPEAIVKYELGGIGEQRIFLNLREHIKVLYKRTGFMFLFGLPVLCYKFLMTRKHLVSQ
ncbi:MAG: glycosyltransferase [Cyclobacteriaceae bacterium]